MAETNINFQSLPQACCTYITIHPPSLRPKFDASQHSLEVLERNDQIIRFTETIREEMWKNNELRCFLEKQKQKESL